MVNENSEQIIKSQLTLLNFKLARNVILEEEEEQVEAGVEVEGEDEDEDENNQINSEKQSKIDDDINKIDSDAY